MRNRVRFVSAALAIVAMLSAGSGRCRADGPADEALKAAGVRAGLCVDLDVADGRLTAGLHGGGRFLVHGLARDEAGVRKARQFIEGSGLYGPVSVDLRPAGRLPYADNIVNLAVAEDLPGLLAGGLTLEEVARVLAPSGVLCFGGQVDEGRLTAAGLVRRDRAGELEGHASSWPADPTKRVPPAGDPLQSYIAEGEILDMDPRSFGGIGVFAIPGFARFYRHVLIGRHFPHHAAVAFARCGRALFDAVGLLGVERIGTPLPPGTAYPGENVFDLA